MYNIPVRKRKQTKEYPMTRKHFELIANAIRVTKNTTVGDDAALRELALNLCVEFKRENGRFNTNRFLEACGL
tara:strand:- start:15 stop:233 length:219 start_codon:yes stop_codon:yes gene_type:complete